MKTIYLVRHAKSSWGDLTLPDFDRSLNERGQKNAPEMARPGHCKSLGGKRVLPCHPDLGVMAEQIAAIAPASRSSARRDAMPGLPAMAPEAELPPPRLA